MAYRTPQNFSAQANSFQNLKIASINVRTLSDKCHLQNLLQETKNVNWNLIGLSEVSRTGEEI